MAKEEKWRKDDFIYDCCDSIIGLSDKGFEKLAKTDTLVIPEETEEIGRGAFFQKTIRRLYLPTTLKGILAQGFEGCSIEEIYGGENVEVADESAFRENKLKSVSNFKKLRYIGTRAFSENFIESFTAPETLEVIDEMGLALNLISIVDLSKTKNLQVGENAFFLNEIKEVRLGSKTSLCSPNAFEGNSIETVKAFKNEKVREEFLEFLKDETFDENFKMDFKNDDWTHDDFYTKEGVIVNFSEMGLKKLEKLKYVVFPYIEEVNIIGEHLFDDIGEIKFIYISDGYEKLLNGAFFNAETEYIRLPETLRIINDEAFKYSSIKYVKIPKNVHHIGECAFYGSGLIKADLSESEIMHLSRGIFAASRKLKTVLLPNSLIDIKKYAFEQCNSLQEIVIPRGVGVIEKGAFLCTGLKKVYFNSNPNPLIIEDEAFLGSKLEKLTLYSIKLKEIGANAFRGTCLKELNLHFCDSVKKSAFRNTLLESVWIKQINLIKEEAFLGSNIKTLKLGGEITIKDLAFHLNHIEEMEFMKDSVVQSIGKEAFSKNYIKNLSLDENVKEIRSDSFIGNTLEDFSIDESIEIKN